MSLVGTTIGHIRVMTLLGRGGMGEVYAGYDETLERQVAIKAMRGDARLRPEAKARFLREARILSRLKHPNICQIHGYAEHDDSDVLVLELIEGETLRDAALRGLDRAQALRIAEQIARALVAAHEQGVIHRDLKPSNVMLTRDGEVKVLDFGLARADEAVGSRPAPPPRFVRPAGAPPIDAEGSTLGFPAEAAMEPVPADDGPADPEVWLTQRGHLLGTPLYMSPEQARGEAATAASDLYSFGLLLQTLLTGRPAYEEGLEHAELLRRVARGETLPPAGVKGDLAAFIRRLTAVAPPARPTARDAVDRLRWIRDAPRRRLRNLAAVGALVAIALAGLKYTLDLRRERGLALQARDEARTVADFLVELFEISDPGEARGRTITAREILDRGARRIDTELAEESLTGARLRGTIGTVYRQLGLYAEAEPLLDGSLATRRKLLDADDPAVGESVHALAVLREQQGRFQEAAALFREAIALREAALGPEHLDTAESLHGLALLHLKRRELDAAEPLYRRTLAVREKVSGPDSAEVAATLRDMGILAYLRGDLADAEELYRRALAIQEQRLGPDHPDVGATLNSLGSVYLVEQRHAEAEPLYRRALAIREATLGADHPAVAISLNNLAALLQEMGRVDEVGTLYERALAVREKALGPDHPEVAESLTSLGDLLVASNRHAEALPLYERALSIRERALGPDHAQVAASLVSLAGVYDDVGRYEEAERLVRRSVVLREGAPGEGGLDLAESLFYLAHVYHHHLGRETEAAALYERVVELRERALGGDHAEVVAARRELADALSRRSAPPAAR